MACLIKPIKEAALEAAIVLAVRHHQQFEVLRQDAAGLRQALEARKVIERAKGLLSKYCKLGEQEAYNGLRKLASGGNRRLTEVAQDVLAAGEVFQALEQMHRPNESHGHAGSKDKARPVVKLSRPALKGPVESEEAR